MHIVVLAGGISTEREVSLSSGSMVAKALQHNGHKVVLLDAFYGLADCPEDASQLFREEKEIQQFNVLEQSPDIKKLKAERPDSGFGEFGPNVLRICQAADMVYMGLHGENGENGRIQAAFDLLGIKYTGTGYLGSALAMDKWVTKQLLMHHGVKTPNGQLFHAGDSTEGADAYGFPCVVKPVSGGSSVGVVIAENAAMLEEALAVAAAENEDVLVEQYIKGREFSCGLLGDAALPPIEIIPKGEFYDYAHKYQPGWTTEVCPAIITDDATWKMQSASLTVYKALNLSVYSRVDFLMNTNGELFCLEANTLPGMTPTSLLPQEAAAVGIDYEALCERIVQLSLAKYQ
ncbi:MAG: D-alanine--D-alanine ligase [Eubacteriales bacterium]|nr:D-alanine--D-alanine ligase [Eubacteriales bacterium]